MTISLAAALLLLLGATAPTPVPVAAAPPPQAAPAAGPEVRLRWQATSESDIYGYIVYRSARREGPFRRVSREIVRKKGGPGPNAYVWVDAAVEPDRTYYYYLDTVSLSGKKTRFSPVQQKVVGDGPTPSPPDRTPCP